MPLVDFNDADSDSETDSLLIEFQGPDNELLGNNTIVELNFFILGSLNTPNIYAGRHRNANVVNNLNKHQNNQTQPCREVCDAPSQ